MAFKPRRVRDPLHNLVEFEGTKFGDILWKLVQSRPFQRLRRIKQLGFSELVYPGATHTRFAHSLGVYHTAKLLSELAKKQLSSEIDTHKVERALTAALLHDIGHGPFSHAFEEVGKRLNLANSHHEKLTETLIKGDEITDILKNVAHGFANDVSDVIKQEQPRDIYDAIVSSQFDADRLDYMRRDRLMTGTQNSAIDFEWLLANLQVKSLSPHIDGEPLEDIQLFVLDQKALHAAEGYVLGLFQLYPSVYLHKTTRSAGIIFTELLAKILSHIREGNWKRTGLPCEHPLVKYGLVPEKIDNFLALDDTVIWGALPFLINSTDEIIKEFSVRLRDRKLLKTIDIEQKLLADRRTELYEVRKEAFKRWFEDQKCEEPFKMAMFLDEPQRHSYSQKNEDSIHKKIMVLRGDNPVDIAEISPLVSSMGSFKAFRVCYNGDAQIRKMIEEKIKEICHAQ